MAANTTRFLEEISGGTGKQLEATSQQSLWRLSQQTDVSKLSAQQATNLLLFKPYKFTAEQKPGGRPCGEGTALRLVLLASTVVSPFFAYT